MKYVIVAVIISVIAVIGVVAVNSSAVYLDDSFRWGGRDG